ncbi:unnamed protein product [Miscanthus lutarioriparius]|uniref:Transposase n=1 Tax=Miscanthus lutarioriparius TaxID=422564 RepID=A0A811Q001_9POAL|nr:unnamed protein product [Miscanthus lutarioriparius]
MENIIHMDEKWFNTTSKYKKYYMLPGENDPHRTVQNKNHIGKVMFLSAEGKPMYDDEGNIFDGKIGVWPFVRKEQAKRRRGRGTQVTKPIKSLTYERISRNLDELIQNVQNEFDNYDPDTLNRVFLTLQGCLVEVMKDGGNKYKIPHIDKDRLQA